VSRKITRAFTRIKLGLQSALFLGNLDAKRDWGHARDYVRAQWLMLQHSVAEDFVIATGTQFSVRDFVAASGRLLGMPIEWRGQGVDEVGIDMESGKTLVRVDPRYFRPTEVETLLGDPSKAREKLGWTALISFTDLVAEMIASDLEIAKRDALVSKQGYQIYGQHE
jgi:GDPmannose 4,6-dehydratase